MSVCQSDGDADRYVMSLATAPGHSVIVTGIYTAENGRPRAYVGAHLMVAGCVPFLYGCTFLFLCQFNLIFTFMTLSEH